MQLNQEVRAPTNDGLPDEYEVANGLDPLDASDAALDDDQDGASNLEEYLAGTEIDNADTDGDGMTDGYEINAGLNPNSGADATSDQDSDGLTALQEFNLGTSPTNPDTDGDILSDGEEVQEGRDPLKYEPCPASPCGLPLWLYIQSN